MDKWIQQILILTLMFTLCGGFMLVFRRLCVSGSGRTLKRLWCVVLILAVLPLHILPITLPTKGQPQSTNIAQWLTANESALVGRLAEQLTPAVDSDVPSLDAETDAKQYHQEIILDTGNPEVNDAVNDLQNLPEKRAKQLVQVFQSLILCLWLCGAIVFIVRCQYSKIQMRRGLKRFSRSCREESWQELLHTCAVRVGIKQKIKLYIVDAAMPPVSPCIDGWIRPKLYIHTTHLNDSLCAEEIFVHELQHLHSMDVFYKNVSCAVMALHWFNPITYLIWPRLLEDCELSCDSRTLEVLGEERRISYMKTILNIAATTQHRNRPRPAALNFCEPSGKKTLKRRYKNVASMRLRPAARITALCLAIMMVFACIGCQLTGKKKDTLHLLTPLTEEMVRFYYDLSPEDEITQEMLDGVTSLFVYRDMSVINAVREAEREGWAFGATRQRPYNEQRYTIEELAEYTILDFVVNYADTEDSFAAFRNQGDPMNLVGCMNYVPANYMQTVIFKATEEGFADGLTINSPEAGLIEYDGLFLHKQFMGYYLLKDISKLTSERQIKEIKLAWPGLEDQPPFYIFDPTADTYEWMCMYVSYAHVGLLDNRLLETNEIDTDIFKVFPNLTDLKIVGLNETK